jgi:Recombination endonuclease VII
MKRCTRCGVEKSLDDFYRNHGQPTAACKACTNAANVSWRERHKAERTAYQVAYNRARQLGMTHAEYVALAEDPGKECAICGVPPDSPRNGRYSNGVSSAASRRLSIDHSHSSGRLRGFLCSNCNNGLGRFADNPVWLRRAADYLEKGAEFPMLGSYKAREAITRRATGRGGPTTSRPATCSVGGCEKPVRESGLCGMHAARLARKGTLEDRQPRLCSIEGCGRKHYGEGYCRRHWWHWKQHGDPGAGRWLVAIV